MECRYPAADDATLPPAERRGAPSPARSPGRGEQRPALAALLLGVGHPLRRVRALLGRSPAVTADVADGAGHAGEYDETGGGERRPAGQQEEGEADGGEHGSDEEHDGGGSHGLPGTSTPIRLTARGAPARPAGARPAQRRSVDRISVTRPS